MKKILFAFSLFLPFQVLANNNCFVVRGVVDIGSGTTKVKVNVIDICLQNIKEEVYPELSEKISYKADLEKHSGIFSDEIIQAGLIAIQKLISNAETNEKVSIALNTFDQDQIQWSAIATSAFRTAKNGPETAKSFSSELSFPVKIISEEDEARFGFIAGSSQANDPRKALVWDIGGGSQQVTFYDKGKIKKILLENKGTEASKTMVIRDIEQKNPDETKSPNPIGKDNYKKVLEKFNQFFDPAIFSNLATGREVIGIGRVHRVSISAAISKPGNYTKEELQSAAKVWIDKTDTEINDKYADTFVTNIILVLAGMEQMNINTVHVSSLSIADGYMLDDTQWPVSSK